MPKKFPTLFELIVAGLSLILGLQLWKNLALHFAEIEKILPSLQLGDLVGGKAFFFTLIGIVFVLALIVFIRFPWNRLFHNLNRPGRLTLSIFLFGVSFVPLFWVRFGGTAWLIILLIGVSFFLNLVGVLILSAWLAQKIKPAQFAVPPVWTTLNPWLPAVLLFVTCVYFSHHCFGLIPHVEDSIAQLLQARVFALGHAAAEPFTPKEFFFFGFMVDFDRWFSQYSPGHPLLLTLGVLIGYPHLINPLLGAIAIILFYFFMKNTDNANLARWGVWAMALSPYVIFMNSEFMNHATALTSSLLGWLALKKAGEGRKSWLILSGLAFGYCAATRPLEGVIFGCIGGFYLLFLTGKLRLDAFLKAIPYVFGFLLAASLYPIHNALTTGDPFTTGYQLSWGGSGFGLGEVNWGPPHTFGYGLVNTFMSIAGMNVYMFEIPVPALLGIFIWALWGPKLTNWDRTMLAAMILIPAAYLFYYFHDYCFGPRYYYVLVPQLLYFTIKGVRALYHRLTEALKLQPELVSRGLIWAGAILLVLQASVAVPFRSSFYADNYWGTNDGPMKEARRLQLKHATVFIENQPWEVLQTKLHSLGYIMGDAHRLMFYITLEGLNEVLAEMGFEGDESWGVEVNLEELERRIVAWHQVYIEKGNPPIDPWAIEGFYTYFSNGVVHQDPSSRNPQIFLVRDLGDHNHVMLERYPDRKAYRYAYDSRMRRFRILPLVQ